MESEETILNYCVIINKYKDEFRRIELELFKIMGLPPRHIIYREALEQDSINRYEYDTLMEWEDKYGTLELNALIRSARTDIKETKLGDNNVMLHSKFDDHLTEPSGDCPLNLCRTVPHSKLRD